LKINASLKVSCADNVTKQKFSHFSIIADWSQNSAFLLFSVIFDGPFTEYSNH